jgi:hypothetical protein
MLAWHGFSTGVVQCDVLYAANKSQARATATQLCHCSKAEALVGTCPACLATLRTAAHQFISASSMLPLLVPAHMCSASFASDPGIQAVSRAQYTPHGSSGNAWNTAVQAAGRQHSMLPELL